MFSFPGFANRSRHRILTHKQHAVAGSAHIETMETRQLLSATNVVLNMNEQASGNNGANDAIVAQVAGLLLYVSVNGRFVSVTETANVQSLTIIGSNDADSTPWPETCRLASPSV